MIGCVEKEREEKYGTAIPEKHILKQRCKSEK